MKRNIALVLVSILAMFPVLGLAQKAAMPEILV